jgi:hypothetical protein
MDLSRPELLAALIRLVRQMPVKDLVVLYHMAQVLSYPPRDPVTRPSKKKRDTR